MAIYLAGEVNNQMYLDVAKRLDKKPHKINICLNSEGGDLMCGLAIYDRLLMVPDCTITATGENSSAATIILQAATLRRATPMTQFYFHLAQICNPDPEAEEKQSNTRMKVHLDQVMFEVYNTRLTPDAIREALARKIFGAETALKLGIIDSIWRGK